MSWYSYILKQRTLVSVRLPNTGMTPGAAAVIGVALTSDAGLEVIGPVGIDGTGGGVVGMGPAVLLGAAGDGGGEGGGAAAGAGGSAGFSAAGAAAGLGGGASPTKQNVHSISYSIYPQVP